MTTNFLWNAGTSNSGLLVSSVTLMTTELNSLVNAGTAVSSVAGTSGKLTNSNTGQGMITAGWVYKAAGPIMIPALQFKIFVQNNLGQTLASSANTIKIAPYAMSY